MLLRAYIIIIAIVGATPCILMYQKYNSEIELLKKTVENNHSEILKLKSTVAEYRNLGALNSEKSFLLNRIENLENADFFRNLLLDGDILFICIGAVFTITLGFLFITNNNGGVSNIISKKIASQNDIMVKSVKGTNDIVLKGMEQTGSDISTQFAKIDYKLNIILSSLNGENGVASVTQDFPLQVLDSLNNVPIS